MAELITYKTIDDRNFTTHNGVEIINLCHQVIDLENQPRIMTIDVVSDELAGKPNVISKIHYGTENLTDLLCTFNGIANPFDLQPGTRLLIPFPEDLKAMVVKKKSIVNSNSNISNDKIVSKAGKLDPRRVIPKFVNDSLSAKLPNTVSPNTDNTIVDGDVIVLGANSLKLCDQPNDTATQKKSVRIRNSIIKSLKK